jgi:hypothetical protein
MEAGPGEDITRLLGGALYDVFVALAVLLLTALLYFWLIPVYIPGPFDDKRFAYLLCVGLTVLGLLHLRGSIVRWRSTANEVVDTSPSLWAGSSNAANVRFLALLLVWAAEMMLMRAVGFYILAPAAVLISLLLIGVRKPIPIAAWTLIPFPVFYLIFEVGLRLRLPRGWLAGLF